MSDHLIRQRKRLAMGESLVDVPAIENPFRQCEGSNIPRGEMKDSRRKGIDQDRDGY